MIELRNELEKHGFHTIAGAAFAAEHAFSHKLAAGRPDEKDWKEVQQFIEKTADKIDPDDRNPEADLCKGRRTDTGLLPSAGNRRETGCFSESKAEDGRWMHRL